MKSLVHQPSEPEAFYEREISASLENGGNIQLIARGDSIGAVIGIITALLPQIPFNGDRSLDFNLRYWQLTEDLDDLEIKSQNMIVDFNAANGERIARRLIANVKKQFIKALARQQITLRGPKGELS
ncbi:MAG TPA: hypothetical protein VNN22_07975 [Verrucomicrobiae bacterium]|nr:hypothetical protein [Verrucomicrobiae bacterium]